jgi:hypothetical protein
LGRRCLPRVCQQRGYREGLTGNSA